MRFIATTSYIIPYFSAFFKYYGDLAGFLIRRFAHRFSRRQPNQDREVQKKDKKHAKNFVTF
ncbi:MAG: hypothetical protein J6J61_08105 [Muribaculaceae bacterium]|nr:hypothetical protein [Muribaculaceae bacterium]